MLEYWRNLSLIQKKKTGEYEKLVIDTYILKKKKTDVGLMFKGVKQKKDENWDLLFVKKKILFWWKLMEKELPLFDYENQVVKKLWYNELVSLKVKLDKLYTNYLLWNNYEDEIKFYWEKSTIKFTFKDNAVYISIYKSWWEKVWCNFVLWIEYVYELRELIDEVIKQNVKTLLK